MADLWPFEGVEWTLIPSQNQSVSQIVIQTCIKAVQSLCLTCCSLRAPLGVPNHQRKPHTQLHNIGSAQVHIRWHVKWIWCVSLTLLSFYCHCVWDDHFKLKLNLPQIQLSHILTHSVPDCACTRARVSCCVNGGRNLVSPYLDFYVTWQECHVKSSEF